MDVEQILALSRQGYSRRQMAGILGMSRNTLKKYLQPKTGIDGTDPGIARPGKLETHLPEVRRILDEDPGVRAMDVYRHLKELGYVGGYDLVKKRMREIRLESLTVNAEGGDAPGRRARVDIGRLDIPGRAWFLFSMVSCHSGKLYAEFTEKPDLESFLNCHQRAFRFFHGVPRELIYETSRNKCMKRLAGHGRFHLPLIRLAEHFDFSVGDAPPYSPWTAGRLKRPLCQVQALFLPQAILESSEQANAMLLNWLLERETAQPGPGESVAVKFDREKPHLGPLPARPFSMFSLKLRVRLATQLQ